MEMKTEQTIEDYEPFGPEWEKTLMKYPKAFIIELYRNRCQSAEEAKEVMKKLIVVAESYEMCFPKKPSRQKKYVQDTIAKAKEVSIT